MESLCLSFSSVAGEGSDDSGSDEHCDEGGGDDQIVHLSFSFLLEGLCVPLDIFRIARMRGGEHSTMAENGRTNASRHMTRSGHAADDGSLAPLRSLVGQPIRTSVPSGSESANSYIPQGLSSGFLPFSMISFPNPDASASTSGVLR